MSGASPCAAAVDSATFPGPSRPCSPGLGLERGRRPRGGGQAPAGPQRRARQCMRTAAGPADVTNCRAPRPSSTAATSAAASAMRRPGRAVESPSPGRAYVTVPARAPRPPRPCRGRHQPAGVPVVEEQDQAILRAGVGCLGLPGRPRYRDPGTGGGSWTMLVTLIAGVRAATQVQRLQLGRLVSSTSRVVLCETTANCRGCGPTGGSRAGQVCRPGPWPCSTTARLAWSPLAPVTVGVGDHDPASVADHRQPQR